MGGPLAKPISRQEVAFVRLVLRGFTNREIGGRLGVSEATVKAHVSSVLRKLQVANRAELATVVMRLGLINLDT